MSLQANTRRPTKNDERVDFRDGSRERDRTTKPSAWSSQKTHSQRAPVLFCLLLSLSLFLFPPPQILSALSSVQTVLASLSVRARSAQRGKMSAPKKTDFFLADFLLFAAERLSLCSKWLSFSFFSFVCHLRAQTAREVQAISRSLPTFAGRHSAFCLVFLFFCFFVWLGPKEHRIIALQSQRQPSHNTDFRSATPSAPNPGHAVQ